MFAKTWQVIQERLEVLGIYSVYILYSPSFLQPVKCASCKEGIVCFSISHNSSLLLRVETFTMYSGKVIKLAHVCIKLLSWKLCMRCSLNYSAVCSNDITVFTAPRWYIVQLFEDFNTYSVERVESPV